MAGINLSKATDLLTYILAVGLAASCIAFAGYKVVILQAMENPPPDMGLNFPAPKRKVITDDTIQVDSLITGSTGASGDSQARRRGRVLQPYTAEPPIQDYRLLTVIDGVAFVEVLTLRGRNILPLIAGARLPGAGQVERVERVGGRWTLTAGDVTLLAEPQ